MSRALTKSKFLTQGEFEVLNQSLMNNEKTDFRNTTFLWTLIHTGARVSEVLNIRGKDLSFEGMSVFISGLKNSRDREIPLTPFLFNRLKVLSSGPEERLFPFGYNNARAIWNWWRPAEKKIHSIRHYRAQEIYRKTKDVRLVQRVLGHKFLTTTMIYLEFDYDQDELRRALF